MLDEEKMEKLLTAQKNEITEFFIYDKLSRMVRDSHNRDILERISREELEHHKYWKEHTNRIVKPSKIKIWTFVFISRVLGLTFGLKLIFPYLILENFYLALGFALVNAIIVISIFTFYTSIARDTSFRRGFLEMALLSFGIACFTFGLGFVMRQFFKVDI